jgi:hypothetical protein
MTSNLGARFLEKRGHLGFSAPMGEGMPPRSRTWCARSEEGVQSRIPEPPGRSDSVHSLTDDDLIKIMPAGGADQRESGGQADQDPAGARTPPSTFSRRPAATAATARVRCAGRCRSTSRIRLSEALIQGSLPPRRAGSLSRRHRHLLPPSVFPLAGQVSLVSHLPSKRAELWAPVPAVWEGEVALWPKAIDPISMVAATRRAGRVIVVKCIHSKLSSLPSNRQGRLLARRAATSVSNGAATEGSGRTIEHRGC